MNDDLDDLKKLIDGAAPPRPRDSARQRAKADALAAFDAAAGSEQKKSAIPQGSAEQPRQRIRQSGLMTLFRRLQMNISLPSTKTVMLGGTSLAVLTIAIVAALDAQRLGLRDLNDGVSASRVPMNVTNPNAGRRDGLASSPNFPVGTTTQSNEGFAGNDLRAPVRGKYRKAERRVDETVANQPAPAEAEAPASPAPVTSAPSSSFRLRQAQKLRAGAEVRTAPLQEREESFTQPQLKDAAGSGVGRTTTEADAIIVHSPTSTDTYRDQGRDRFEEIEPNQIKVTTEEPVSTFSIDVDTASYAFMRSALMNGVLPQKDSVRIEELINYFPYDYAVPESRETPFSTNVSIMPTPWNDGTKLMRIGIQGYELGADEQPRSNLVFLLDTSGSMNSPDKLPLLIQSFSLLVDSLDEDDTVSIVVYAGSAGTVLPPTKVKNRDKILESLERLQAGGSTAGGEGIRQAYRLAEQNFDKDGINRVILATDGDFNVGITDPDELQGFIERKRDTGVFLSVLGFGRGNYNDELMQTLAQNGNGNAAYIDTLNEARKTLVEEASSTLFPIAKDVKIQVEFNPTIVAEYRLIGYETRILNREDFNNDKVDAGEIGAGHTVTALYEITPVGSDARLFDELRFETTQKPSETDTVWNGEVAFVRVRYKELQESKSKLIEVPIVTTEDEIASDADAHFAAAVAAFGQLLRGGRYTGGYSYDDVVALAKDALGEDPFGYRAEFVNLARRASIAAALEPQK